MIETRHQAPGRFTVKLDNPPERVRELLARFHAAVIVLPGKVNHPEKMPIADLYAAAQYVGIHTGREDDRCTLNGYGPAYLLTLARQPASRTISKRPLYNGSSNSWVRNNVLRVGSGESNGITAGPIMVAAGAATPTKGGKVPAGQEPLETLGDVARRFGKEWSCDKGVLEVAARSALFTVTPTVVAAVKSAGSDLNMAGLEVREFVERDDVDDFATEVAVPFTPDDYAYGVAYVAGDTVVASSGVFYECVSGHTSSGANQPPNVTYWAERDPYGVATTGSVPYVNPFDGADLVARRVVQARNATTYDDASDIAAAQLDRFDDVQRHITLKSAEFNISGKVRAGDNIYAFDPGNDLVGSTQVPFRGRVLPCATVRVRAVREAVSAEKQVLVYSWDGSGQVLDDVTSWVAFEQPGQTLELGEPRRRRPTTAVSV